MDRFRILIPKGVSHYSVRRAAFWLGMSPETTVEIPVDSNFRIIPSELEKVINSERQAGNIPIAVVAYAGNSRTMSIDDFPTISMIAKKNNMWFHIDACHGSSLAFSEKLRGKIKGIELADSVTIDPHKVLFVPYNLSYILVKDPKSLEMVTEIADICTTEPLSLGSMTPFIGSIESSTLKLWFLLKHLGVKEIGRYIEERHFMAKWFAAYLSNEEDFVRLNDVEINSCAFYYLPKSSRSNITEDTIKKYNKINKRIFRTLFEKGEFYIHSFPLLDAGNRISKEKTYTVDCLRLMPGNPLTTQDDLIRLIDEMKTISKSIVENESK